jgi:hypothetical protein
VIGDGANTTLENIILSDVNSSKGIGLFFSGATTNIIKNNVVSGFNRNIDGYASDTAIVHNNISNYGSQRGITINSKPICGIILLQIMQRE